LFTYHNPELAETGNKNHEYQGLAYSNDRGRTWTKYAGNPVLPNTQKLQDFRDPKVFWHRQSGKWVMAVSANDHVQFWGSDDLKNWRYLSDFGQGWGAHGGVWECPDLVEMRVQGSDQSRWVLIQNLNPGGPQGGSGTQYFVGDFDGGKFSLDESFEQTLRDEDAVWLDAGRDNYAGVTWSDLPADDGRTLFIGWMGNWDYAQQVPTKTWRSAMTLPRELQLHKTEQGYRVYSLPVAELKVLRKASNPVSAVDLEADDHVLLEVNFPVSLSEVEVEFKLPQSGNYDFGLELSNELGERYRFGYDSAFSEFYSDRTRSGDFSFSAEFSGVHRAARLSNSDILHLHLFIDVASIEVFADHGANVLTDTFFPSREFSRISVYSTGSGIRLLGGEIYQLESIWSH
jgi:fructan beta-fructosidase